MNTKREKILFAAIMLAAAAGLVWGWRLFWFLTDDAFISFRYISNSILGYGYVWNAPPFMPVEGYTSFLWVVILDGIWRVLGIEPPDSANWVSLGFAFATLFVCGRMIMNLNWSERLKKFRLGFLALLFIFLLLNRTFLAWSSSGLETAMFDFLLIAWVYVWTYYESPVWKSGMGSLLTSLLTLSRPDGLLFTAATIVMIGLLVFLEADRKQRQRILLWGVLPLTIAAGHEGWRLWFYGEWLPNTYYAKYTGPWPEAGWHYFLSFTIEYALWVPMLFAAALPVVAFFRRKADSKFPGAMELLSKYGIIAGAIGTLFGQFFYYTFLVGGDHFEYRVYCQFLPLVFIGFVSVLNRIDFKPAPAFSAIIIFIAFSLPIPWAHWFMTKDMLTREETFGLFQPVSSKTPQWLRWYTMPFDNAQHYLVAHAICIRHQEHKVFWQHMTETNITRAEGLRMSREGNPVLKANWIGIIAWTLPRVNIIDVLGLNDYVIARTPIPPGRFRVMAHSRIPPDAYIWTFHPNVSIEMKNGRPTAVVTARQTPLTDQNVHDLERSWRNYLANLKTGGTGAPR